MARPKAEGAEGAGTLIVIGGQEDRDGGREILKEVARHVRDGRRVLATIASHEPEGCHEKHRAAFADLGVTELHVDSRQEAMPPGNLEALDGVDAVFLSDGGQFRIASQGGTPVHDRIHAIFRSGG